jgi:hypothetical protein
MEPGSLRGKEEGRLIAVCVAGIYHSVNPGFNMLTKGQQEKIFAVLPQTNVYLIILKGYLMVEASAPHYEAYKGALTGEI